MSFSGRGVKKLFGPRHVLAILSVTWPTPRVGSLCAWASAWPPFLPHQRTLLMLRVLKLKKTFGGQDVLNDVSFEIADRAKVALVGANGAGKSSLLKIIAGGMAGGPGNGAGAGGAAPSAADP